MNMVLVELRCFGEGVSDKREFIRTLEVSLVVCGVITVLTLELLDVVMSHDVHLQFMLLPIGGATDITDKRPDAHVHLTHVLVHRPVTHGTQSYIITHIST